MHPLAGMAIVLGALGTLLGGLTLLRRFAQPHPELLRKLVHIGMGLVTLSFPWVFDALWPVVTLAVLSILLLASMRLVTALKNSVGQVVCGVSRSSLGEIYFPLAVAILWALYLHGNASSPEEQRMLYVVPILLLTVADAVAALVGVNYGHWHYATAEGHKSTEGSAAFLLCSVFCIHVPLLLMTDLGRPNTLLIAVLLGWLATMFEAIAWAGLDNLVLPLVSHLLLALYWTMSVEELLWRLGLTVVVFSFALFYARRTTLLGNAVLGAALAGYITGALGGWKWLIPPLIVFCSYTLLSPRTEQNSRKIHNVHSVVCVASAGTLWLLLSRLLDPPWDERLYFPFTVTFAGHLVIIALARQRFDFPNLSTPVLLLLAVAQGWVLVLLPFLAVQGFTAEALLQAAIALPAVAAVGCAFYFLQPGIHDCPVDTPRWLRQATLAGVGSGLAFVPVALSLA